LLGDFIVLDKRVRLAKYGGMHPYPSTREAEFEASPGSTESSRPAWAIRVKPCLTANYSPSLPKVRIMFIYLFMVLGYTGV
jgi:hypothetical protein